MQIACVGHASIDHVFQIQAFPQRATKTPAHDFQSVGGGMAANAALAMARLGAQVRFVGAVGDDDAGRLVRQQLAGEGLSLQHLQEIAGARTSASAIIVDNHGDRQIFNHLGNALSLAQLPDDAVFEGCDAVLVDPRWPAGARAALSWARRHRRLAVLDADVAPVADLATLVPLAQWAVFSEPGLAVWAADTPHDVALRRALAQGAEHAVVTLGEHGVLHAQADQMTALAAFRVRADPGARTGTADPRRIQLCQRGSRAQVHPARRHSGRANHGASARIPGSQPASLTCGQGARVRLCRRATRTAHAASDAATACTGRHHFARNNCCNSNMSVLACTLPTYITRPAKATIKETDHASPFTIRSAPMGSQPAFGCSAGRIRRERPGTDHPALG
jgi:sulfofructose kinase